MRECMDVDAVLARLKKTEGQIRGIIRMVEREASCEDILIQIGAVKAALHKTGQVILEGHLHHCVISGIAQGNADATMEKLAKAIDRFSRLR